MRRPCRHAFSFNRHACSRGVPLVISYATWRTVALRRGVPGSSRWLLRRHACFGRGGQHRHVVGRGAPRPLQYVTRGVRRPFPVWSGAPRGFGVPFCVAYRSFPLTRHAAGRGVWVRHAWRTSFSSYATRSLPACPCVLSDRGAAGLVRRRCSSPLTRLGSSPLLGRGVASVSPSLRDRWLDGVSAAGVVLPEGLFRSALRVLGPSRSSAFRLLRPRLVRAGWRRRLAWDPARVRAAELPCGLSWADQVLASDLRPCPRAALVSPTMPLRDVPVWRRLSLSSVRVDPGPRRVRAGLCPRLS